MRIASWLLFLIIIVARTVRAEEQSDEWPCWRGLSGQGVALATKLPDPWPETCPPPRWEAKIGIGWSSPVVAAGRLVVSDRQGDRERVLAFDAENGRELWVREHPIDFETHAVGRRHGNGPKATAVLDAERVYCLGIAGWLECLDARDGHTIWQVSLPAEFGTHQPLPGDRAVVEADEDVLVPIGHGQGATVPLFGYTGSPRLEGDRLICSVGGERGATIIAFDKRTGKPVWQALHEHVSYSSPVVAEIDGMRQIVVMTGPHVVGLDPADGRLLWSHPFQLIYDESISTPVIANDVVVVGGTGKPLTALRIERSGNEWSCRLAWENFDLTSYLSSMVVRDRLVYGMSDGGEFCCVDLRDGSTVWSGGSHGYYSTPVLAGERILALNERGWLLVLTAQRSGYRELGRSRLAEVATWTSPAVVGSRLYLRGDGLVRCFDFSQ
ncbi:MAG TPA: PQQ-binding-like beta-propeller repeat protein [Pirellulales bacterium]|nr:PQQ-binding-like beta-propeller repeat protein [Pirellulales bacterium]